MTHKYIYALRPTMDRIVVDCWLKVPEIEGCEVHEIPAFLAALKRLGEQQRKEEKEVDLFVQMFRGMSLRIRMNNMHGPCLLEWEDEEEITPDEFETYLNTCDPEDRERFTNGKTI